VQVTKVIKIFKTLAGFLQCTLPSAFNFLLYLYFTHTLLLQLNWKFHVAITLLQQKHQCEENPNVGRHESQNEKLTKMSLEVYPKTRKRARTVSGDSLCHFAPKKKVIERLQYPKLRLF
jgi:hypothetical protein